MYQKLKDTGRIDAFRLNWKPGQEPKPHIFWDSDVAKWVEGASYDLALHPDPELRRSSWRRSSPSSSPPSNPTATSTCTSPWSSPEKRWTNLRDDHELYCAGHLMEAAVAYHEATGSMTFLDAMLPLRGLHRLPSSAASRARGAATAGMRRSSWRWSSCTATTGEARYLQLAPVLRGGARPAAELLRGRSPRAAGDRLISSSSYLQAHVPCARRQTRWGIRCGPCTSTPRRPTWPPRRGTRELRAVCDRLWESVTERRMYLTGGVGSERRWEGFTADYDLPNETAYCETCAAIGLVFFAHRMLQFECDRKYAM